MNYQVGGIPEAQMIPPEALVPDRTGLMAPPGGNLSGYEAELYPPGPHMDGEYSEIHSLLVDGGDRFSVSCAAFDAQEELLWMGNQGGHVTSYYSLGMQKYTSFQVHATDDVRQILTLDSQILALTRDTLRCNTKLGMPQFTYVGEALNEMQCMLLTGPSSLLIGGHQPKVVELDVGTQQEIRQVEVNDPGCAIFRFSHSYVCAGDTSGKVTLRDPNTLKAEHVLEAHSGTLSDFDVHGNQLITCGFSSRMGGLTVDRFLMVYDLRVMRAMSPMQVPIEPMFLRIVPTYADRICVVSQTGQFHLLEQGVMTPSSMIRYQVNTEGTALMAFDISTSCQAMAFGDGGGYLHLFAAGDSCVYNTFSTPTEFAPVVEQLAPISIADQLTPLSIIPMQYPTSGNLLSDWPQEWCQRVYRKPMPISDEILRSVKMVQNIGYAPNPGMKHRNQVPYKVTKGTQRKASVPDSPLGRGDDPFVVVPKRYRKVEIKYSKLGVEDFDFRHYNKTNFAGLETHIPNAYCNAMLQMLYFVEPLRIVLLNHVCQREFCLTCELGFLFHMLDQQKGKTCQASNFLRAFRTIPEASALGLILADAEEAMGKANMPRLIQSWNRFILQQVHSELSESQKDKDSPPRESGEEGAAPPPSEPKDSIISTLFGTDLVNKFQCRCSEEMHRDIKSSIYDLVYPEIPSSGPVECEFAQIVQQSMCFEQITQAWCNKCGRYQPHNQTKTLKDLPEVLVFNCHLENQRDLEFWKAQEELAHKKDDNVFTAPSPFNANVKMCRYGNGCTRKDCRFRHENDAERMASNTEGLDMRRLNEEANEPGWIPLGISVKLLPDGKVEVVRWEEEENAKFKQEEGVVYYDLHGTVAHIRDSKSGGNLISHIKVGETFHQRKEKVTCTQWYLFNDFSITPVEKYEGVYFNLEWKIPCIVYFQRRDLAKMFSTKVVNPITSDILFENASLVTPRRRHVTFTPLDDEELPSDGDVVGLDAEFVTLNIEEAELRSDGTRSTIKPSQMSLARVTCVRGKGVLKGEPFIDDYISTQEQVVDYLTQFSGIKPGDLDASISSKHLTTLKLSYMKLRYLIDQGVIFVGHGLKKDFRVINLVVPKNQVIDTVELFHQPRQRMISLKFLAWFFLGVKIQSLTHDSIEDARTAISLYEAYREMSEVGPDNFKQRLKDLYEKGRKLQWKIPEDERPDTDSPLLQDLTQP